MARIANKLLKIFARDSSDNGVFGSAADNTKILSNDVEIIQSKPAWLTGWWDAVIGTRKFPTLEEFQSVSYVTTSEVAYQRQEGIPEYLSTFTYYQNGLVKKTGTYEIYGSITDNNVGNPLSDTDNWQFLIDLSTSATVPFATEAVRGIAEIATIAETNAGTDDERFITPLKLKQAGLVPTGSVFAYALGTTAPAGYVMVGGRTIGSAASGATERANADTETLFIGLWNNYSNTLLPIQDSSGTPTTRGGSAAADFAANKRLPTLDLRGRVIAGLDNMGGTPAGRLTGQPGGVNGLTPGNSGGGETTTISASAFQHRHEAPVGLHTNAGNNYVTTISLPTVFPSSGQTRNMYYGGGGAIGPIGVPTVLTGEATGFSGATVNNIQPTMVLPFIMKL